jgi:hypothetical protein
MKNMHMRLAAVLVLLVSVGFLANAANDARIGTAAAQELLIPVGARGLAVGGSSVVLMTGAEAIYWNPAGLSQMTTGVDVLLSNMNYFADIGVMYGAIGVKMGDIGSLGFSIKSINFGDIPVTTPDFPDGTGQHYSPTFITLGATYAKALTDRISVGVTTMIISERIMNVNASDVAFNFGLQYRNLGLEGLDLGLAVKNIGPNMAYGGSGLLVTANATTGIRGNQSYSVDAASSELPSMLEMGLGYRRKLDETNEVSVAGLFRNNNYQDDEYNFGAEYSYDNLLFIRGGYTFAPEAAKDLTGASSYIYDYTLGAGVHYLVGDVDLSVDYAYRHMKYFTGNNIIALRIGL